MKLYLALAPSQAAAASRWGLTPAHMAYEIRDGVFLRNGGTAVSGGLMALRVRGRCEGGLSGDIFKECSKRGFEGIILEPDRPSTGFSELVQALSSSIHVWSPESPASGGSMLFPASISTGVYSEALSAVCSRHKPQRLMADLEILRHTFALPTPGKTGNRITGTEAESIIKSGKPFYSNSLCVNYCAYSRDGKPGFLLFDNAG